ncbi:Regulatory protein BlaR1 [compost metagenome]
MYAIWFLLLIKLLVPVAPQSVLSVFNLVPTTAPTNINWYQAHEATTSMSLDDIENDGEVASLSPLQKNGDQLPDWLQQYPSPFRSTTGSSEIATTLPNTSKDPAPSFTSIKAVNPSSAPQKPLRGLTLLSVIWLSGVLLLTTYYCINNWRFRQQIRTTRKLGNAKLINILAESKQQLGIDSSIAIYETSYLRSPCLYGIFKPSIYVPEDVVAIANTKQLTHIVMHELMHFKRKDLWVNLLWAIALGIHWFNPVVWWAVHKMRADQEVACDTGVLSSLDEQEVSDYGLTLLMMSRLFKPRSVPQIHLSSFFNRKSETKRRIIMVANFKKGSYKMTALAIVLLTVLGTVLLTNSTSSQNNKESGDESQVAETPISVENNVLLSSKSSSTQYGRNADSFKWFHSLDRALQFKEFDFKVPDYIPEGYILDNIWSTKSFVEPERADQTAAVTIFFSNEKRDDYHSFEVIAALEQQSLLDRNMLWGAHRYDNISEGTFKQATVTIGHITGTLYTEGPPKGQSGHTKAIIGHSFVWEHQGITYAINYKNNESNTVKTNLDGVISQSDLANIVDSFVEPQQVQHVNYSGEGNSFPIYTENDLDIVQNILGFKPKMPVAIQGTEFEMLDSLLLRENDTNTDLFFSRLGDALWSSYRIKSFPRTNKYDLNDDISLIQSRKPLLDNDKLSYQREFNLNGLNVTVYAEEKLSYLEALGHGTGDDGRKTLQTPTYYMWQVNDVYYTVSFNFFTKDINYDELFKALIISLEQ